MRVFISIELEDDIKEKICNLVSHLKQNNSNIRWVKPENLHITLAFLGEICNKKIPVLCRGLQRVSKTHNSFKITFSNLGFFPNPRNPRVLWIGIERNNKLYNLKQDIDNVLDELGIYFNKKPFLPHLTIGRIKTKIINYEYFSSINFKSSTEVKGINLMESKLYKTGPIYNSLFEVSLKKFD